MGGSKVERMTEVLKESGLPFLLAIGGLALSFYMVNREYDSAPAWCAVIATLLGAAIGHELGHRRRLKTEAEEVTSSTGTEDGKGVPVAVIDGE
jgi:hypothetical protein